MNFSRFITTVNCAECHVHVLMPCTWECNRSQYMRLMHIKCVSVTNNIKERLKLVFIWLVIIILVHDRLFCTMCSLSRVVFFVVAEIPDNSST